MIAALSGRHNAPRQFERTKRKSAINLGDVEIKTGGASSTWMGSVFELRDHCASQRLVYGGVRHAVSVFFALRILSVKPSCPPRRVERGRC